MKKIYYPVKRKTILVVEEEQGLAEIYRDELCGQGFQVKVAINIANARHALRNESVDLVILDLSAPGMKGIDALKEVRLESERDALPIIVLSNSFLGDSAKALQEAVAVRCVTKANCTARQLLEIVREVLAGISSPATGTKPNAIAKDDMPVLEFQARLTTSFLINGPEILATLRAGHYALCKMEQDDRRRTEFSDMRRQMHSLAGLAGLAGYRKIAQLVSALEALFVCLCARPANITPSVTRTVAQAIDTLASLFEQVTNPQMDVFLPPRILVVDDEIISRETICCALGKANLTAVRIADSCAAQRLLEREPFDLIFLDVEMPGQSGLALCTKIREMPVNRDTPVVFVTGHCDFGSRAQSALSGGNDFIAKPFLLLELGIKALTWLFRESPRRQATATAQGSASPNTHNHSGGPSMSHLASEPHRELLMA